MGFGGIMRGDVWNIMVATCIVVEGVYAADEAEALVAR